MDNAVGIPVADAPVESKSTLNGMGESFIVQIYNPLPQPFRGQFSRSVVQSAPLSDQNKRMAELGAPVTKDMGQSQAHVIDYVTIPPGKTINLPGDIAQVVVKQMTNYILQVRNRGKGSLLISDPKARQDVEREIIQNYESIAKTTDKSPEEVIRSQIEELNKTPKEAINEPSFPENPPPGQGVSYQSPETPQAPEPANTVSPGEGQPRRKPGRPARKAQ